MSSTRLAYLGIASLTASCTPSGSQRVPGDTGVHLAAVTYNLGLLESVGYVAQRAPLAIQATAEVDADLLCVQEVWEQVHWDQLAAANAPRRPYLLRLPPEPGVLGRCGLEQYSPLESCAEKAACASADSLVGCVTTQCPAEVSKLDSGCTQCLLENAARADLSALRTACVGASATGPADSEHRAYISGGSYGTGLLSARAFAATDQKRLDASTVRRAILYARLDGTSLGTLHVFCTHLSALLTGLKYEGSFGDWNAENAAHVQALIDWVHEKAGDTGTVLILGDLNTGPAGAGITASAPESFAKFGPADLSYPFLSGTSAACTFCNDNPLVSATDAAAGAAIDHVLTRRIPSATVTRVFDRPVDVQVASLPNGAVEASTQPRSIRLSDHYGLRAALGR